MKNYPNVSQSFGIVGIAVGLSIGIAPLLLLTDRFLPQDIAMLLYYLLVMGGTYLIVRQIKMKREGSVAFNWSVDNYLLIPLVIIATVCLLFGIIYPVLSLIPMPESVQEIFMNFGGEVSVFSFLLLVVAAPVLEELIFRGIMMEGLIKRYSPQKAILISSMLFGLVHLNPWQFIVAFLLGIFLGWIYYNTKSVLLCIIIHGTTNLLSFIARVLMDSGMDAESLTPDLYNIDAKYLLVIIGSNALLYASIYLIRQLFSKSEDSEASYMDIISD
nr:type II CAAX endopeptidase family protein [uncultured Carboxylicivirga sp.]